MRAYLLVSGAGTLLLFGLPILFSPLRWARLLQWEIPDDVRLVRYFGRSLGCVAVAVGVVSVYLGLRPEPPRAFLLVGILATGLLTLIHVIGALERAQPWTETVEIALWFALTWWGLAAYTG